MSGLALVTGGAGWLGSRLVGALVQGLPECGWMPRPDPRLRVRCLVLPGEDASLIEGLGLSAREASRAIARAGTAAKNRALEVAAEALVDREKTILAANAKDVKAARAEGDALVFDSCPTALDHFVAQVFPTGEVTRVLTTPVPISCP